MISQFFLTVTAFSTTATYITIPCHLPETRSNHIQY